MSLKPSPPVEIRNYLPFLTEGPAIWLVGGVPRDHLLGRVSKDFDFVVDGKARKLARRFADQIGGSYYDLDRERDIGRVILTQQDDDRITFDFARLRGSTIEDDLYARDFAINAIAIRLDESFAWIDPLGGGRDIQAKILKPCSAHSLRDDPIRALRAVRFALRFDFQIADEVRAGIEQVKDAFDSVSCERIRDEIMQICGMAHPGKAFRLLDYMGILGSVFPEFENLRAIDLPSSFETNALEHTFAVLDRLADILSVLGEVHDPETAGNMLWAEVALRLGRFRNQLTHYFDRSLSHANRVRQIFFLAALYHAADSSGVGATEPGHLAQKNSAENGARIAEKRARDLRLSNVEIDRIGSIVRQQGAFAAIGFEQPPSPRGIYRYFRTTWGVGIEIVLLALANYIGANGAGVSQDRWAEQIGLARVLLEAFFEKSERFVDPVQLIDGEDVMRILRIDPGPTVGELLEIVREAQATGEVETRDAALSLVRKTAEASTAKHRELGE